MTGELPAPAEAVGPGERDLPDPQGLERAPPSLLPARQLVGLEATPREAGLEALSEEIADVALGVPPLNPFVRPAFLEKSGSLSVGARAPAAVPGRSAAAAHLYRQRRESRGTSTGYDSLLACDLDSRRFEWGFHLQRRYGAWSGFTFDPRSDLGPAAANEFHINMVHVD